MGFGVREVTFSQFTAPCSIIPTIFLTGCSTASFTDPHADDMPANYRRLIADYMRTQSVALGLLPAFRFGIKRGEAEIADPHKAPGGYNVCVRLGGQTVMSYGFVGGQLVRGTGGIISQGGQGVLQEALNCGANPNFKPFPEAEFQPQPQPQPRT
ncbi:MAG TPA: hypothetical protein VGJ20_07215 [Xanthobacteraceae bacterium]